MDEEKYGIELDLLTGAFNKKVNRIKKQADSIKEAFNPDDISGLIINNKPFEDYITKIKGVKTELGKFSKIKAIETPKINTENINKATKKVEEATKKIGESTIKLEPVQSKISKIIDNIKQKFSNIKSETIDIDIDVDGAQIGTALANINNLEANGLWKFKAIGSLGDGKSVASYKLMEITGF